MAKSDTMTIAFPNGGILPRDVTGDVEHVVGPHEAVEVPRAYGEHLTTDRFAYEVKPDRPNKVDGSAREKQERHISSLRAAREKAVDQGEKDKIADKIVAAEKKLAEIQAD